MLNNNAILEIKDLDVAYGHAKALHDVSLSIKQGETCFVIGRNGAGKTTLLKTITGLLKPVKGSIIYEGRDISGLPPERISLEGIRYVAQEKKVFGNLTVRENIELAAYGLGEPMEQALDKVIGLYPKIKNFLKRRKANQPYDLPSAGSVFVNPDKFSAGELIEKCGLKGKRIGGAEISEKHANFIVNLGNAKAKDVIKLINLAKKSVKNKFGKNLEEEIQYLGF